MAKKDQGDPPVADRKLLETARKAGMQVCRLVCCDETLKVCEAENFVMVPFAPAKGDLIKIDDERTYIVHGILWHTGVESNVNVLIPHVTAKRHAR